MKNQTDAGATLPATPSRSLCEDCGTKTIDNCPQCGAPQCCPKCCDEATLELGVRRAVTQGLRDTYSCGRAWEAWHVGTMTVDDFSPAWEDEQIIWDIVAPILGMMKKRLEALKSSENDLLGVALRVLNEAYAADPAAMHAMVNLRVPCNDTLADHPTIQVGANQFGSALRFDVGIVGILNGIFESATGERLAVSISDDGEGIVVGFVPYAPNAGVLAQPGPTSTTTENDQ